MQKNGEVERVPKQQDSIRREVFLVEKRLSVSLKLHQFKSLNQTLNQRSFQLTSSNMRFATIVSMAFATLRLVHSELFTYHLDASANFEL